MKSLADHYPASVSISLILEPGKYRIRVYSRASKQPAVSLSPPPLLIFPLSSYFRSRRSRWWGRGGRKGEEGERTEGWYVNAIGTRTTRLSELHTTVHDGFNLIQRELIAGLRSRNSAGASYRLAFLNQPFYGMLEWHVMTLLRFLQSSECVRFWKGNPQYVVYRVSCNVHTFWITCNDVKSISAPMYLAYAKCSLISALDIVINVIRRKRR